ncbi:MAG: glycosyl transferase family 2 [Neisseria sp.]|nr:glycosyl transferase family 2 [Neisseria sp.]
MSTAPHWAAKNERGTPFFLKVTAWIVYRLPATLVKIVVYAVVTYFYATSAAERRHLRHYHRRIRQTFPQANLPERHAVFRHFLAFGESIGDRFAVWQKKIRFCDVQYHDPDNLAVQSEYTGQEGQRGQIFITSHLGNTEICRAFSARHPGFVMNVLVHSRHAEAFNRALKEAGADDIRLIQVTELDAALMLELNARLDAGQWLAIAADRIPVRGEKTVTVDFLGAPALLPQGPWLLAGLLRAPINILFAPKHNGRYRISIRRFCDEVTWTRNNRSTVIAGLAQRYADELAAECAQNPLQWFNFYDFWNDHAA